MTALATSELRPLSMGQMLDRAIRLYRNNFLKFIGIIAIAQVPSALIALLMSFMSLGSPSSNPFLLFFANFPLPIILAGIIVFIISAILTQASTAALTRAVADNYLGKSISIFGSYSRIGRSWWTLLGASFLGGILALALIIPFIIPFCNILYAIVGIGALLYLTLVVLPLIAPVVVLERQRASQSIYRAWELARRRFWWVFGFILLLTLFTLLIVSGPTALVSYLLVSTVVVSPEAATIINQVTSLMLNLIYLPIQLTCMTLLYLDLRVRTEGFDLALLAASSEETDSVDQVLATAPEPRGGFGPTSSEIGYFAVISIGSIVIGGGFIFLLISLFGLGFGAF